MGTALVAYVYREEHRIELDAAVRVGSRLDTDAEAVLLHTTAFGHCGDTADSMARALRQAGWAVRVRAFDELGELRSARRAGQPSAIAATALSGIGSPDGAQQTALVAAAAPVTPPPSGWRNRRRKRCRVCGHLTMGRGVRSHVVNRQHDDWEVITLAPDGTYTPAQTQA